MTDPDLIAAAAATADRAADRSGVVVRPLTGLAELEACEQLYVDIWGRDDGPPVPASVLQAHRSTGSYVVGAFDGDELIGGCLGFWGAPERPLMHSHIAGVAASARGRDLGTAIKLHQRAYALARGVELVTWTYDPLIARNAHFNLVKLGARAAAYEVNYYGVMPDAINAGDETDRIVIHWDLAGERVRAVCDDRATPDPGPPGAQLIEVPDDIESLRRTDPAAAIAWRHRLRDRLTAVLAAGGRIGGFDRVRGGYLIDGGS